MDLETGDRGDEDRGNGVSSGSSKCPTGATPVPLVQLCTGKFAKNVVASSFAGVQRGGPSCLLYCYYNSPKKRKQY